MGFETVVEGMWISREGLEKRASTEEAWPARGVRARRFVGRCERGSALVGMDSGMGSDMVVSVGFLVLARVGVVRCDVLRSSRCRLVLEACVQVWMRADCWRLSIACSRRVCRSDGIARLQWRERCLKRVR